MEILLAYIPTAVFVLFIMAVLFITAPDRATQIRSAQATGPRLKRWFATFPAEIRNRLPIKRIAFYIFLFLIGTYIWTYQVIQNRVVEFLEAEGKEGVLVGSLVIPYTAFFRTEYDSDTGFSKSKKRVRATVSVDGSVFTDINVHISKRQMVKLNKITKAAYSFSFLTDTKILKPEIQRLLRKMERNKDIHKARIETFDNRGPYILVVLAEKDRDKDPSAMATPLANQIHLFLTKTKKLKVNQVVVKVVDPIEFTKGRVKVLGRGKAGKY